MGEQADPWGTRDERLHALGYGPGPEGYAQFRKTDRWSTRRARYFDDYGPEVRCRICGVLATELHHRRYDALGDEPDRDLVPVCRNCHYGTHLIMKFWGVEDVSVGHVLYHGTVVERMDDAVAAGTPMTPADVSHELRRELEIDVQRER